MSRSAKTSAARLTVSKALPFRRQSKGYRKHNAASRKYADVVTTGDRRRARGGERIGVAGAVGLNRLGKCRASDGVASDIVLVEQVVEAQAELGLVEATARADRVIEVGICLVERVDGGLVVIGAVVRVERADALVEHTKVPSLALIGNAFGLGVGGRAGYPQTGRRGDDDRRTSAIRRSAVDAQIADVGGTTNAGVEIDAKAMGDVDVTLR